MDSAKDSSSENKISRRDFLKLVGSGAAVLGFGLTLGKLTNNLGLNNVQNSLSAYANTPGSWSMGPNLLSVPIHAALLPNGKIFYLTGDAEAPINQNGPFLAGTLDPATNSQQQFTVPSDISCGGNCNLPSGNLLLGGGTLSWDLFNPNARVWGGKTAYEFDFAANTFVHLPDMAHGRWYPTYIVLPNGNVHVVGGEDEFGCLNQLVEIYNPSTKTFTLNFDPSSNLTYCVGNCAKGVVSGAGTPCFGGANHGVAPTVSLYPRMHLMPNGLLALVGMSNPMRTWDPSTGHWVVAGHSVFGNRNFGTSVLLPLQNTTAETGRILTVGGSLTPPAPSSKTCEIVTFGGTSLQSRFTGSMNFAREFLNAVILPTGAVFVNGGTTLQDQLSHQVYAAEMFDPVSETWTVMPSATVPRRYHSVSILLPDGRIWTAGTTLLPSNIVGELRTEIFSPAYVSSTRPVISGAAAISGGYGGSIMIPTSNAAAITSVSLVKISGCTHHFNNDQRLIWLQIRSRTSNSVTVAAPINANLAPPGYYLIHVLNSSGTPSVGKFIKIPA